MSRRGALFSSSLTFLFLSFIAFFVWGNEQISLQAIFLHLPSIPSTSLRVNLPGLIFF